MLHLHPKILSQRCRWSISSVRISLKRLQMNRSLRRNSTVWSSQGPDKQWQALAMLHSAPLGTIITRSLKKPPRLQSSRRSLRGTDPPANFQRGYPFDDPSFQKKNHREPLRGFLYHSRILPGIPRSPRDCRCARSNEERRPVQAIW